MNLRPHARNTGFEWSPPPGPYRRVTAEQARSWSENGYFLLEDALDPRHVEPRHRRDRPLGGASVEAALREQGGKRFIARADEITFTVHLVLRSQFLRDFCAGPLFAGPRPRPARTRRPSLLGPGGLQEARHRGAVPLASGQRLQLRRAAVLPDLLDRAHRRHRGERLPVGGARDPPHGHARALDDAARLPLPRREPAAAPCRSRRRREASSSSPRSRRTRPAPIAPADRARRTSSSSRSTAPARPSPMPTPARSTRFCRTTRPRQFGSCRRMTRLRSPRGSTAHRCGGAARCAGHRAGARLGRLAQDVAAAAAQPERRPSRDRARSSGHGDLAATAVQLRRRGRGRGADDRARGARPGARGRALARRLCRHGPRAPPSRRDRGAGAGRQQPQPRRRDSASISRRWRA